MIRLPWDSSFFGLEVAEGVLGEHVGEIDVARGGGIDCLYLRGPAADVRATTTAAQRGARIVDIRTTLRWTELDPQLDPRVERAESVDALLPAAAQLAGESRFARDPRFEPGKVVEMYEEWLRRCCAEGAVVVPRGGGGFVAVAVDEDLQARVELVYVDAAQSGRGLGSALVMTALAHVGARAALVATQAWNGPALRLYHRCGFSVASTDVVLHAWLDEVR